MIHAGKKAGALGGKTVTASTGDDSDDDFALGFPRMKVKSMNGRRVVSGIEDKTASRGKAVDQAADEAKGENLRPAEASSTPEHRNRERNDRGPRPSKGTQAGTQAM